LLAHYDGAFVTEVKLTVQIAGDGHTGEKAHKQARTDICVLAPDPCFKVAKALVTQRFIDEAFGLI